MSGRRTGHLMLVGLTFMLIGGCASTGTPAAPGNVVEVNAAAHAKRANNATTSRVMNMLNPNVEVAGARRWPQPDSLDIAAVKTAVKASLEAYRSGRFDDAERFYLQAEQLGASDETMLYWLGNFALMSSDLGAAQRYYESVLRTNPSNAKALYNLAVVYLSRAEDHFQFYAATVPETEVEESLLKLLASIDRFSDGGSTDAMPPESPLDSLRQMLEP